MKRQIVQIATIPQPEPNYNARVLALADDGSLWIARIFEEQSRADGNVGVTWKRMSDLPDAPDPEDELGEPMDVKGILDALKRDRPK